MGRKMIDYQVEDGKITSIDGYSVGGGSLTNKLYQHSLHLVYTMNGTYWIEFTMLTSTPDKFTSIKAIHDYMIQAYGEHFYIPGYIRGISRVAYGVHISPAKASGNSIYITVFYQNTEDEYLGESGYTISDSGVTITDNVFQLI